MGSVADVLLIEELLVRVLRFLPSTAVYRTTIVCTAWNAAADQCPLAWSSVWTWGHPTLPSPADHRCIPQRVRISGQVTSVVTSRHESLALTADGLVFHWNCRTELSGLCIPHIYAHLLDILTSVWCVSVPCEPPRRYHYHRNECPLLRG